MFFIPNGNKYKENWKNFDVFCTNIEIDESNILSLADLYRRRWNIENFYRDAQENFMIKTKTENPIIRFFFFIFSAILYNLWYFIREFISIIAEKWKDSILDLIKQRKVLCNINCAKRIDEKIIKIF
ncbi:MAG: transposase [Thermoplasmatales archaeon]|nr:transposase [Thermoplasmatales archaeon]MBC7128924.1 transposase [Thermoplasmatales archaeon]MBC7129080.1 transposase [Thermoplasmatales archaeon]MBC7129124.1 transposase [Thermoplasmatales archaeon]